MAKDFVTTLAEGGAFPGDDLAADRDHAAGDWPGPGSGTVSTDDPWGPGLSDLDSIICFTPGIHIATPRGARRVEDLRPGDVVVTRDHGLRPLRWVGRREVAAAGSFAPVRIRPGVVPGQGDDLLVSPQHRMLFTGYRAELLFGESEVLVAAEHLVDGRDVTREPGGTVTYIHLMFDQHEVIFAEGAATESFYPAATSLSAVEAAARDELFAVFPGLRADPSTYGTTARRCLNRREAVMLNC